MHVHPLQPARRLPPAGRIYTCDTTGRHTRRRQAAVWLTQAVWFGLPWLSRDGAPALRIDLAARRFHLFGSVFWPQDLVFLAALMAIAVAALFLVAIVGGRVWCAWGCPHAIYGEIFQWIERRIEGGRSARMRRDAAPWNLARGWRKLAKHAAWLSLSAWIGITLAAYFTPMRELLPALAAGAPGPTESFLAAAYGGLAYVNAGWMRTRFCRHVCAWARFQSAMADSRTPAVAYDAARGEPRAPFRRQTATREAGDCVDCTLCVQACPSGIDIRDGDQYDCIDCGACIDACDTVMGKLGRPRGLIRRAAPRAVHGPAWMRPRVIVLGSALLVASAAWWLALAARAPLRLSVVADRPPQGAEAPPGTAVYRVRIVHAGERARRVALRLDGAPAGLSLRGDTELDLAPHAERVVVVRVSGWENLPEDAPARPVLAAWPLDGRDEAGERATVAIARPPR